MNVHERSWTFMTAVDCLGLSWTVVDCRGLPWTVVDCREGKILVNQVVFNWFIFVVLVVFEFLGLNKRFYQFLPSFSDFSQKNTYRNMHESHLKKTTFFIICTLLIKIESILLNTTWLTKILPSRESTAVHDSPRQSTTVHDSHEYSWTFMNVHKLQSWHSAVVH